MEEMDLASGSSDDSDLCGAESAEPKKLCQLYRLQAIFQKGE